MYWCGGEVALVDPGPQSAQVQDGPTVSRVEAAGPDQGPDTNQRIQKLLATVKKSELLDETQTAEFETFLGQYHDVFSLEDGEERPT